MLAILNKVCRAAHCHVGKLFLCGFLGIIFLNWRLWRRDKALLNRRSQSYDLPKLDSWSSLPLVSILVAAWNEAENIEMHINSFKSLRYPNKELILCAGGEDGTLQLAQRNSIPGMVVIQQMPGEGKQHALQRCFSESLGSIIYLTDADCFLDNESFERLVYQIVSKGEQAVSGSSQPLYRQSLNPFILSQAASQIYSANHSPTYAPGLLGRNCAMKRELLDRSHGLEDPVLRGTDYVLAKKIYQTGARIRQIPRSRVATAYPASVTEYAQQQLRWLDNVVTHGNRYAAYNEIHDIYAAYFAGIVMLFLPFVRTIPSRIRQAIWSLLFWHACLSRLRYLMFSSTLLGVPINLGSLLFQPILLLLDSFIWVWSLIESIFPNRKQVW